MITVEDQITIRNIKAKNPKVSFRSIAKLLGISHNTVKAALNREGPPEYERQQRVNPALEPFHELIFELLNKKKYRGSKIFNEIVSKGYKGSKSPFYEYLKKIKIEPQKSFTSYETAPGEQAQFDWSPYTLEIGGELVLVYIYSYINSFSRYQIFETSLSQDQGSIFEALENSFEQCNGVCDRLQTDNAKVFVQNPSRDNLQWNKHYLQFVNHYGFKPSRSLPGHPWSKGKVEKPFEYLETHFITGSNFESFLHLQDKLKEFQNHVNSRVHSTIKEQPQVLFEVEKPSLLGLPQGKYISWKQEVRKVASNCFISFNGSRYSVPNLYAGKFVWLKVSKGFYLHILNSANRVIAEHLISLLKGKIIYKEEHFKGNKTEYPNFEHLSSQFVEMFPGYQLFIEKLHAQKRHSPRYQLSKILELSKMYDREDFIKALDTCLKYNMFNITFIAGYLEKNHKPNMKLPENITLEIPKENVIRNLQEYSLTNL